MNIKLLKIFAFVFVSSILFSFTSFNTLDNSLTGTYYSPNKKSKIEFFEKKGVYYGKLIWNENSELIDKNNSITKLRTRKLVGTNLFFALKYINYLKVWKGKFYDPTSGLIYDCDIWLTNSNKTLMARGYLEYSILSRTEALQRVN